MCKCPVLVAGRSLIVASSWNALSLPPSSFYHYMLLEPSYLYRASIKLRL